MKFNKKAFLMFFLIFFSLLNTMIYAEWYTDKIIQDIKFKGLNNIAESELTAITAQFIGKTYTDDLFWDIQGKLFALDYFDEIIPNAIQGNENLSKFDPQNTVVIEFNMIERPVVKKLQIKGNKNIRKNQILDTVLLKPGDLINKTKITIDEENILNLYIEKGFPDVAVNTEIGDKNKDNEVDIVFNIEEGSQTKIGEIQFKGNSFASDSTLRRVIDTKKQSLFSKGLFLESKIQEDKQKIAVYYGEKGFIDAKVTDVIQDLVEDDEGNKTNLVITFVISEGKQYKYGGIIFNGNVIFKDEELYEQVKLKEGEILDKTQLEADFSKIADLYYNDGYIFNVIKKDESRNEEEATVFYNVRIIEQGRAHIENITIRGNDKTKDKVILRELPLEVGDIFSKKKIIEGVTNLYNLQYFSTIEPDTPQGNTDGLMDLIINVEEGKTTDVQFGLTFTASAGDLPIMSFIKWTDRNFMGNGQELSIGTELSGVSQSVSLGFTERWLANKRWTGGVTLSLKHRTTGEALQDILSPVFPGSDLDKGEVPDPYTGIKVDPDTGEPSNESNAITDYEYALRRGQAIPSSYLMEYESWDVSFGLNTGYTWHTPIGRFNTSTGYTLSRTWIDYNDEIYRPYNETVRDNFQDWQTINKTWYSAYWDTRDIVYNPTKGFYLKQSLTYTGGIMPSKRNYISTTSKGQYFKTLLSIPVFKNWEFKTIFAANSSLSLIWKQFDGSLDITTDDMFYVDGLTMARGWPRVYDGQALWDNWVELRMPIIQKFLWWDWFYSWTGIWTDRDSFTERDKNDYYFSLGGGFRLTIPGLPIGFYFTKRYQYIDNEIVWYDGPLFGKSMALDFVIGFTPNFF
ncbi:MAG: outer membrane protein assembly factor BamA [Spirochaetia bacterium]|jgi:outer membrane protein insertion porin family|nr:outer membrane protein assembly factor BamA [Spirochaetia bacterium]